jgi:uncharacterized protein YndB with AHSA1/START domain
MERLEFSVLINASPEKIWQSLWDDGNYRQWASVFSEGSYALSDWNQGSRVQFLSPSGEGMSGTILQKDEPLRMVFSHEGMVKAGVKQPLDEETKAWAGAEESYLLEPMERGTRLTVSMDMVSEHKAYFEEKFPAALQLVKELAEA